MQLMQSSAELHYARQVQYNILSTVEALGLCVPGKCECHTYNTQDPPIVLQQYCQLKEQMESKQFYSALKTLEQLEHTSLPQVEGYCCSSFQTLGFISSVRYTFSDLLRREIPKLRRSIEDQSNAELTVSMCVCSMHGLSLSLLCRTSWQM